VLKALAPSSAGKVISVVARGVTVCDDKASLTLSLQSAEQDDSTTAPASAIKGREMVFFMEFL
jgi:hypothetical protein